MEAERIDAENLRLMKRLESLHGSRHIDHSFLKKKEEEVEKHRKTNRPSRMVDVVPLI